jgi:hypothetical protein
MGYVWNTTKMWRLWDTTGRRVVVGSNVKFDEHSIGGSERPKLIQEVDEVFNEKPERDVVTSHEPTAVDDGSKGRLHVGEHVATSETQQDVPLADEREQSVIVMPQQSPADV